MKRAIRWLVMALTLFPVVGRGAEGLAALRERALRGEPAAMHDLGEAYAAGAGIEASAVEAYVWLTLAADRGIESPTRSRLFGTMTAAQFAQAARQLAELRAKLPPSSPVELAPLPVKPIEAAPAAPATPPAEVENLRRRIAQLENDLVAARAERTAPPTGASLEQLRRDLNRALQDRDLLSNQVAALRRSTEAAEAARDRMQVELEVARAQLATFLGTTREGQPADDTALREALRQAEMKIEMTVRAFGMLEMENRRFATAAREADARAAAAAARRDEALAAAARAEEEAAAAGRARDRAIAEREAALRDLAAAQIRIENLVRELSRARPGMPLALAPTAPAPVESPAPEPAPAPRPRTHVVVEGENLSIISQRYYATPHRWAEIFAANRDVLQNENVVAPGTTLRIP